MTACLPALVRSAALSFALIGLPLSQAVAQPAASSVKPAGTTAATDDLQDAIVKSNAYTALMNRTLRAIQSWERYASWVDMKRGPTGKERYITYGMYSLYDVKSEIAKAEEVNGKQPALPEIDETIRRYIKAYQELAPLVTRGERYYERKDYLGDDVAEGRELHAKLVPAATAFLAERATLDAQMRVYKKQLDARELAAIEAREGRLARWQVRNIMINARAAMDLMPSNDKPIVDIKALDAAIVDYAAAVREMDTFKDSNPSGLSMIDSQASSWLGRLRDFRTKVAAAKGDARRGGGNDVTWIVNTYNTMVSMSDTAIRMSR